MKFVDQDGDGRVNKVYGNHEDKIVLGCSRPDFEGGFNTRLSWKGLTLSVQGTFSYGAQKAWTAEANQFCFASTGTANVLDVALKRWTPENPDSNYPWPVRLDSTTMILQTSPSITPRILKYKTINLEYRFPKYIVDQDKDIREHQCFRLRK